MYIYIHIYILCICMYIFLYASTCLHTHTSACEHIYTQRQLCSQLYVFVCVCARVCEFVCMGIHASEKHWSTQSSLHQGWHDSFISDIPQSICVYTWHDMTHMCERWLTSVRDRVIYTGHDSFLRVMTVHNTWMSRVVGMSNWYI